MFLYKFLGSDFGDGMGRFWRGKEGGGGRGRGWVKGRVINEGKGIRAGGLKKVGVGNVGWCDLKMVMKDGEYGKNV